MGSNFFYQKELQGIIYKLTIHAIAYDLPSLSYHRTSCRIEQKLKALPVLKGL